MLAAKFDPHAFFQRTDNVALHVAAGEVFSLLKRRIDLPPQWAALVARSTGDRLVVRGGGVVEAEDVEDILFVRTSPADCKVSLDGLFTQDGYLFHAELKIRLATVVDRTELTGFLKTVVGSRRVVQAGGLEGYIRPPLEAALGQFVRERPAEKLLDSAQVHAAREAAVAALQVPLFAAGLGLEGEPAIRFESASYRQVLAARDSAAARQAEHEAAQRISQALHTARTQHLSRLEESLARLREVAQRHPEATLPELVRSFSQSQRGELYEALFSSQAAQSNTQWIVAACGDELIFFDATGPSQPARRFRVDGPAGAARSVQVDGGRLLIGAARGVYVWPVDGTQPEKVLVVPGAPAVRGGFNAVARAGELVSGSHSELGIWEWGCDVGSGRQRFEPLTRGAKAVRGICAHQGTFFCAIDDRVAVWTGGARADPDSILTGATGTISALCPMDDGVFGGTSEGELLFWRQGKLELPEVIYRGVVRPIESVAVQRVDGVRRVVFADTSPRVHARVLGDSFSFHYEAGGQTIRRVEVASDLIVGMNELRDRLFCWHAGQPQRPMDVIQVGAIVGRNVQDLCLIPEPQCA